MHYVFYGKDKPGHLQTRLDNRAAHVEWLKTQPVVLAGPYLDDDEETMIGSFVVLEVPDRPTAHAVLEKDPYAIAGLFESFELRPWKWVIGTPNDV